MRGSAALKVLGGIAAVGALATFLIVGLSGARTRAHLTHCRNNLRRLGEDAIAFHETDAQIRSRVIQHWEGIRGGPVNLDAHGRGFWQSVRLVRYSTKVPPDGIRYDVRDPDMFDCPVDGLHDPDWDTPETIDYRGPAVAFPPRRLKDFDPGVPFAADRVGNHGPGEGGFVLYLNLTVRERVPELGVDRVVQADAEGAAWVRAAESTTD